VVDLVEGVVNPAPATPVAAAPVAEEEKRTIVAVTACPTGIAHTYMAADSLVAAGKKAGVDLQVETQGSSGSTPLPAETIAGAAAVIFATDVGVKDRVASRASRSSRPGSSVRSTSRQDGGRSTCGRRQSECSEGEGAAGASSSSGPARPAESGGAPAPGRSC